MFTVQIYAHRLLPLSRVANIAAIAGVFGFLTLGVTAVIDDLLLGVLVALTLGAPLLGASASRAHG